MNGKIRFLTRVAFSCGIVPFLISCTNAPSPQNTAPSHEAQCAALRTQMLQSPLNTNDNTPVAVAQGQNVNTQQQYHNECE